MTQSIQDDCTLAGAVAIIAAIVCLCCLCGCGTTELKDKQVHIVGAVYGGRSIPQAGLLELGYGDATVDTFPIKAGQGGGAVTRQYSSYWGTNLTFESVVFVFPYVDSQLTVSQQRDALVSVLGLSIPNPTSPRREVITVEPK